MNVFKFRQFVAQVVLEWDDAKKMALFMALMSVEMLSYITWMLYVKHSDYAHQHVNLTVVNELFPFAVAAYALTLIFSAMFYFLCEYKKFICALEYFIFIVYSFAAAYIGYLVGQDNIISAIALSTAGVLVIMFSSRNIVYFVVGLNILLMFTIMYADKSGALPPSPFFIGSQDSVFWVYSYFFLCVIKVVVVLILTDNMLFILKQSYKHAKFVSEHDMLTGLPNRGQTLNFLQNALQFERPVGVVMIDLDHFKQVNDSFGHLFGDTVLEKVGGFLQENLRKHDLVGRYGGEEFLMVLPNTSQAASMEVANHLHAALQDFSIVIDEDRVLKPSASFGVVASDFVANKTQDDVANETLAIRLFELADCAMYTAKQQGRGRVVSAEVLPSVCETGSCGSPSSVLKVVPRL